MIPLALLAALAVVVFFIGKLLVAYATRWTSIFVESHMLDAELILRTGLVPARWLSGGRLRRRMSKPRALRRLDRLVKYYERTPFVENDTVRKTLVDRLDHVLDAWENADWSDILPRNNR